MTDHIYKIIELTGSSPEGTDQAIRSAVRKAGETVKHMDWFEVVETRGSIQGGDVQFWQVTIKVGFRIES
ncbi:dodecin [Methylophaga sp.]|jgi:flavin-binding protein dodecin|uniref:dodecin n=1 Tax=Methylophaga sp. TaxID=2024840 RepID=UPI0013FF205D|nr:dodecin [Methylophaga sp.]MTI64337.1 dodecin domain-containing protein [Methylophaga sp.]